MSTAAYQAAAASEGFSDDGTAPDGEEARRGGSRGGARPGAERRAGDETVEGEFKEV